MPSPLQRSVASRLAPLGGGYVSPFTPDPADFPDVRTVVGPGFKGGRVGGGSLDGAGDAVVLGRGVDLDSFLVLLGPVADHDIVLCEDQTVRSGLIQPEDEQR